MRLLARSLSLLLVVLLGTFTTAQAQEATKSSTWLNKKFGLYRATDATLDHSTWFAAKREEMQLAPGSEMRLDKIIEGAQSGLSHYKYKQYHLGVPVYSCTYTLHEDNGHVVNATGNYAPNIDFADVNPSLTSEAAVILAKQQMKASSYTTKQKAPVLCLIDPAFPKTSGAMRLAWMTDLRSDVPVKRIRYFIDARNGKVLTSWSMMHEQGVPSTAETKYYGVRNIVTDSLAPQSFILRDPARGITVQNGEDMLDFKSTTRHWNLTNPEKDEAALDAHFCTQEYYDMMLNDYQWQGIDGQGGPLKVLVHQNQASSVNAYWDGEYSNYGDGNCIYGPLTTLEVVSHEFTHGLIDYTSELAYDSESGAINESLADMFGKLLEHRTDPTHFSWDLGHSFALTPDAEPFRVMDDPKSVEMPAYYQGEYWEDDADVHTNSSIGNLWFSMICDGRQGTNELNYVYNVSAIGFEKAGQIVFEANRAYLTENSDYATFCTYTLLVAEQKFGASSAEVAAVREAWKAVGVDPSNSSNGIDLKVVTSFWDTYNSCQVNVFLPVTVKVENTSNEPYIPTATNKAILNMTSFDAPDKSVPINVTIAAGATVEIPIPNWIFVTEPDFFFIDIDMDYNDALASNNVGSSYYAVLEHQSDDLALQGTGAAQRKCFDDELDVYAFVSNQSCDTTPAGTVIVVEFRDQNNQLIKTVTETLVVPLVPNDWYFLLDKLPIGPKELTATLIVQNDPNPDNNESSGDVESSLPITTNYLNNFSVDPTLDPYLSINSFGLNSTLFYQGSDMLAATGYADDTSSFFRCPNVLDIVGDENNSGFSVTANTCLDFSQSAAPKLDFDLAQFRNNQIDPSYQYSSMTVVRWNGTHTGQEVIYGQPEGVKQHKTYSIPANFKGQLSLALYTEIGELWDMSASNLTFDDFQLVDNLQFSGVTSTWQPTPDAASLSVTPNPTTGQARISTATGSIDAIQVSDMQGRTVITMQTQGDQIADVNLKSLPSGVYLVRATLRSPDTDAPIQAVGKVVLLKE